MLPAQDNQSGAMNLTHLNNTAVNVIEAFCSVIAMPVELLVRPGFGTRYFALPIFFFSALLMIVMPLLSAMATALVSMIPFSHPVPPVGMFGIDALSKVFFLSLIVHFVRLARRVLNVNLETHSRYEGPPLPLFAILPGGSNFWRVRTVLEPCLIFLTATILQDLFIIQSGLTLYLRCAAFALAMKSCVGYFHTFGAIRDILDMANAAPVLSKLVDNKATQDDLSPLHLASFPDNVPPETRRSAAISIARAYIRPIPIQVQRANFHVPRGLRQPRSRQELLLTGIGAHHRDVALPGCSLSRDQLFHGQTQVRKQLRGRPIERFSDDVADFLPLLDAGDAKSAAGQMNGSGNAGKTGSDDNRIGLDYERFHRQRLWHGDLSKRNELQTAE